MQDIKVEIKAIEATAELAWGYVEQGEWRKARRSLRKIRNSHCYIESDRVCLEINAEILARQGKHEEVKEKILNNLQTAWGSPGIWCSFNRGHAEVDSSTKIFRLSVEGPNRLLGVDHSLIGTLDILANSEQEALAYLREIELYYEDDMRLYRIDSTQMLPQGYDRRGILNSYPFLDPADYDEFVFNW